MTTEILGGLRSRLIWDSVYHAINDALTQLGWFDAGRQHQPVTFPPMPVSDNVEIALNTVALSDENLTETAMELGSQLVETSWSYYVDFYAESDVIGKHLINDIRDFLAGRMMDIRPGTSLPVYDYRLATPAVVFYVEIDQLTVDRAHDFPKSWQQHWYSLSFVVVDAYG